MVFRSPQLFLTLLLLIAPSPSSAQNSFPKAWSPNFPSGTSVSINQVETSEFPKVKLFASVTHSGVPLTGLTAENFRVRENNIDQAPIKVSTQRGALSVVVLLDVSRSMETAIENTKQAAIQFIRTLDKNDRVAVITFHERIDTLYPLGRDFAAAEASISRIHHLGDTALYDGVYNAITSIKDVPGRRAVVVLSDGVDGNGKGRQLSKKDLDEPLLLGIQTNIPIYTIGLGSQIDAGILKTLAGTTGAEYANAPTKEELDKLYTRIGQKLSVQFAVEYMSSVPLANGLREVKLDYVVPSKKPYAAPKPIFDDAGNVISYRAPILAEADQEPLARMAAVGEMANENQIKPLAKFIEEIPDRWPTAVPSYSKAKRLNTEGLNAEGNGEAGAFSFAAPEDPEEFLKSYRQTLQNNDWNILSQTKAGNLLFLRTFKGESEMTIGIQGEKDGCRVNVEFTPAKVASVVVDKNNSNQIIAANGRDVVITGADGIFIITGGCHHLKLTGTKNQVQCDSVLNIALHGNENELILGSLGEVNVSGNKNEVSWGSGIDGSEPKIVNRGSDNRITKLE